MTPKQKQRAIIVVGLVVITLAAIGLLIYASRSELNYYYSPVEVKEGKAPVDRSIRIGGLVAPGSLVKSDEVIDVAFDIMDGQDRVHVTYDKMLPDLFREGQGVIATGVLNEDHHFTATEILAKHDETYMPPEVKASLEKSGIVIDENSRHPGAPKE
ncbi:cytochrome c maturation protein CcmE [Wohlfahrtiimonas chitiniclastica]|uniref:cytochrome c maturation protein CcmE n=1 Tax=Wohlfahrtiimonas chitiniclastica TaxID=400946 RepID=UPI001BCD0F65|nr:cytochrome c maturation protein CcmE [Wohlfahrtiimonas chitiniclastica]MBS7820055.1 cytochrome c maturation protein CcmE [Wohlfahrtiimonas chitiniclastica]MBS7837882.1 cytochrome c maturation protein CcmE [Wohlfahrtiimonas chitiniclastica]